VPADQWDFFAEVGVGAEDHGLRGRTADTHLPSEPVCTALPWTALTVLEESLGLPADR